MVRCGRNGFVWAAVIFSVSFLAADVAAGESTPAEKLMMVLPEDTLGFAATSGGDYSKASFERSILGRMWNDAGVQTFYQSVRKETLAKLKQEACDPNASAAVDPAIELLKLVGRRPIVVGMAQKESQEGPPFYGFAIVDAGNRKEEIASAIGKLEALVGDGEVWEATIGSFKMHTREEPCGEGTYWGWVGNYLVLALNERAGLATKYLAEPRTVSPDYLSKVSGSGDALAVYVDCEKIAGVVKLAAARDGGSEEADRIGTALKEMGLAGVKQFVGRGGFAGSDFVCRQLLQVEGPRAGLLTHLRTINLSLFEMVDSRAMTAAAVNCDVSGMYDTIMRALKVAGPNDFYAELEREIGNFESAAKFGIRRDLLASIAGPMVFYTLPAGVMMEAPSGGVVGIAKVRDSQSLEKSLSALGQFVASKSEGMMQVSSQAQSDGRTYHAWVIAPLATMQVMPCWTVADRHLIIGSNPTLCLLAAKQVAGAGPGKESLRTTEGFRKATGDISHDPIMFYYSDSQVQFSQMMIKAQQFWPMVTMFASRAGMQLPVMLPSLSEIAKDMGPCYKYLWFDSEGLRSYCRGPGFETGAVTLVPIGAAVLMPALARSRQLAGRVVSGTNLSGIGKACVVYANDDPEGRFPPNLEILIEMDYCSAKQLESPSKPKGFEGPSYIYIAGQTAATYPGNILVYENPAYCYEGVNVVHVDTHVQWLRQAEFMKALKETYERLGRAMPEVKFKGSGG
jgi:hypothetical protein